MNREQFQHILVVRTDRIGDVILSLPMITSLRAQFPSARITMLLRAYTAEIAENFKGLDAILLYDQEGRQKPYSTMLRELRAQRFDGVILAHPTFRLASLMFQAGIPRRVGTGYRLYSFLFNRKVLEHRKTAEKHEAEYNLSLLHALGCQSLQLVPPRIEIPAVLVQKMEHARELNRISDPYIVLHPGSGGSAREWKAENFGALAQKLIQDSFTIVVTGISVEELLVQKVVQMTEGKAISIVGSLSIKELGALIQHAALFVSNSTGPLHLAAAVAVPVIALYPPIRECSPTRWGPLTERKVIFEADNRLCKRCGGGECQGNDCMDQISVDQVYAAAKSMISKKTVSED
ncbi:MAG: glycosyltransferase family 9 protein [bacterium]